MIRHSLSESTVSVAFLLTRDPIPSLTLIRFPSDRVSSAFRGPTVIRIRPSPAVYGLSRRRGRSSQPFLQPLATV